MINYIEYLNLSSKIGIAIVAIFLCIQVVGEVLEFKGKVVPEFIKIRKYFARKKQEHELTKKNYELIGELSKFVSEARDHYSPEKISERNAWIDSVNKKLDRNDDVITEILNKLDRNNKDTLSLLVDGKRNAIISFAARVVDDSAPVTREQFKRIFKIYAEYDDIIRENDLTNG